MPISMVLHLTEQAVQERINRVQARRSASIKRYQEILQRCPRANRQGNESHISQLAIRTQQHLENTRVALRRAKNSSSVEGLIAASNQREQAFRDNARLQAMMDRCHRLETKERCEIDAQAAFQEIESHRRVRACGIEFENELWIYLTTLVSSYCERKYEIGDFAFIWIPHRLRVCTICLRSTGMATVLPHPNWYGSGVCLGNAGSLLIDHCQHGRFHPAIDIAYKVMTDSNCYTREFRRIL